MMDSNRQIELIRKYLKDSLSESELTEFNNFFCKQTKIENWQIAIDTEKEYLESQIVQDKDSYYKNYSRIINNLNKREENRRKWKNLNSVGLAVMPLVTLVIYISGIFHFQLANERKNEVSCQVPAGKTKMIELTDSSLLWVNNKSTIRYNKAAFNKELREVHLAGEAYFRIKKDKMRPFTVHLQDFQIRVTGTEFDVKSYPDEEEVFVSLVEGSINICGASDFEISLRKGQQFIYNKASRHGLVRNVDVSNYIAWRTGRLRYEHAPLEIISKAVERWFDVKIVIADASKQDLILTLNLQNATLHEVLGAISYISRLKYSQKGNLITFYE